MYQRDAEELAELIDRDVAIARGKQGMSARHRAWIALGAARNPDWTEGQFSRHDRRLVYQRARKMDARFVERWGLLGPAGKATEPAQ